MSPLALFLGTSTFLFFLALHSRFPWQLRTTFSILGLVFAVAAAMTIGT